MTTPIRPTTPAPTTPAAACLQCGTTGGYVQERCLRPWRGRGYCKACYGALLYQGHLDIERGDCLSCGKPRGARARGLCLNCYNRARDRGTVGQYPACGRIPVPFVDTPRYADAPTPIPIGIVTPAMLGCRPGQPPTDPGCTPACVWQIGNTNTRRALQWLATHSDLNHRQALDLAVWEPAALATDDAARAA